MELTTKQQQGLDIAVQRYRNGERYTVISGYAGTGKSTLIKYIIAALAQDGIDPENDVVFTAFTGKACNVMQKKGNKNVQTLHRLLYEHRPTPNGRFIRIENPIGSLPYKVVVVDEISMAPMELIKQLAKHPLYVLCCGDPFQLPPVDKDSDNHLLDNPHVFLDQIMRQEAESEIIQLSMKIREGKTIEYMKGSEVMVLPKEDLHTGYLTWADQILCATNTTRVNVNNQMRELMGRSGPPQDGDKLICLRNYWEEFSVSGEPLVNGTIGVLKNSYPENCRIPRGALANKGSFEVINGNFFTDGNDLYSNLMMDKKLILTGEDTFNYKEKYILNKRFPWLIPKEFTYGYAITVHKSQGSEWDKVLVMEERFPFDREEHARWLYTAVTRASEKLILVR